jgi:RNA polymerase sigma-70 factor (ECF subfamily)
MHTAPEAPEARRAEFEAEALVHLDGVFAYARWLTHEESAAEDLTQETFFRAWRSWPQYQPGTNCRAWLFTICRRLRSRQQARESRVLSTEQAELESLAAAALHSSLGSGERDGGFLEMPDLEDALRDALKRLPEESREIVVLVDIEDQSYAETGRILDLPSGTVKSRLYRGRRLLQEQLINFARDAGLISRAGG